MYFHLNFLKHPIFEFFLLENEANFFKQQYTFPLLLITYLKQVFTNNKVEKIFDTSYVVRLPLGVSTFQNCHFAISFCLPVLRL